VLGNLRRGLLKLVVVQIVLGVATLVVILLLAGGFNGHVTVTEGILASAHVMVGALLLAAVGRVAVISMGVRSQLSPVSQAEPKAVAAAVDSNQSLQAGGMA
jgi:hypothetical protein